MPLLDDPAISLLHCLLQTNNLGHVSTLVATLDQPADVILAIAAANPHTFVRLAAPDHDDRIAVVLDLSNCTFYSRTPYIGAGGCSRPKHCPYLHLCPSVISPNRRCRSQECPLDHGLETEHNREVIQKRGLDNLPTNTLIMLVLNSADPNKCFTVCHRKPKPCADNACEDLHFCYYYLINPTLCKFPQQCRAGHTLLEHARNQDFLERRGLLHVNHDDVLTLFRTADENKKPTTQQQQIDAVEGARNAVHFIVPQTTSVVDVVTMTIEEELRLEQEAQMAASLQTTMSVYNQPVSQQQQQQQIFIVPGPGPAEVTYYPMQA